MSRLVECVPNFSEGRDSAVVDEIVRAMQSAGGIAVLDREMDPDHHRSVVTLVGPVETVVEAAVRGVERAAQLIDLNRHAGAHPRIGATDVLPFVPLEGVTMEECVELALRAGQEIWRRCRIPVYFYEAAARRPERINLENIRRGQFEGLREEVRANPARRPDVGGPELHPTAGATIVGARKFLIAYNINLATPDVDVARRIARRIRASSGGMPCVKAMGVALRARNRAQVSMNLTDFERTPVHAVFEAVAREAQSEGTAVESSEIVGLIPKKALEAAAAFFLKIENFHPGLVLENRLADCMPPAREAGLREFLDAVAAPASVPGGGSASAAAAALAASLGQMVAGLADRKKPAPELARLSGAFEKARRFFEQAVWRDAAAYEAVRAARRLAKDEQGQRLEEALREAAAVPLEVAEAAVALLPQLDRLAQIAPAPMRSDLVVAQALAAAAIRGARANVEANLSGIENTAYRAQLEGRLHAIASVGA
jgi:glutamate formiminotransferase/formiminotetrahydrofolate cyclodeaminase